MHLLHKYIREILSETFQSHTDEPQVGDMVVNVNEKCKHLGSKGIALSIQELPQDQGKMVEYECTNKGPTWNFGDILIKTMDQLAPLN